MKIQIVDDDGAVVYVPILNRHLEADVVAAIEERRVGVSRLRPLQRKAHVLAADVLAEVADDLRELTLRL